MKYIFKDVVFTVVTSILLIASLVLIYMDLSKHSDIMTTNEATQKSKDEIQKAYKMSGKPIPVEANISMISADAKIMQERAIELQRIFGSPYRAGMLQFIRDIQNSKENKITENGLREKLRELANDSKPNEDLMKKLFQYLVKEKLTTQDKIDKALAVFTEQISTKTVEDVDINIGRKLLGSALGVPRTMEVAPAHTYLNQIQQKFMEQRMIPGVSSLETVQKYTFDQFVHTFPSTDAVKDILNMMPIFEDIFRRMSHARITDVTQFSRTGSEKVYDKYMKYSFTASVSGSVESIRNFLNDLHNAHAENRVYVVTWINLTAKEDEVTQARAHLSGTQEEPKETDEQMSAGSENRSSSRKKKSKTGGSRTVSAKKKGKSHVKTEYEVEMQSDYGQVLIGNKDLASATISFDYYVFTGEFIEKK